MPGLQHHDNPWARRNLLSQPAPAATESATENSDDGNEKVSDASPNGTSEEASRLVIAWYATDRQRVEPVPASRRLPVWPGPVRADLGGDDDPDAGAASWWWLGVHGGAGVSTLAAFLPGGAQAHRRWPDPAHGGPRAVVLVCRTSLAGLERARDAARQWAASDVPAGLLLGGAVAVADAPGRLPRPQAEALRLLSGAVPRLWTVPWIDDLRSTADAGRLPVPHVLARIGADLESLRPLRSGR
jgi:hypothetical protein